MDVESKNLYNRKQNKHSINILKSKIKCQKKLLYFVIIITTITTLLSFIFIINNNK